MANWYGAARSNYFRVSDLLGLDAVLQNTSITICPNADGSLHCLLVEGSSEDGGWPSFVQIAAYEDEVEFDFAVHVMPFDADGEVVVTMQSGHEKLRYVDGHAHAYVRRGEVVTECQLSLNDIYYLAAEKLGVTRNEITECCY